jgi:hypothetical protein
MKIDKQKKIIILVGLIGCLMTSLTGVAAVMVYKGWALQGGLGEFFLRMSVGYPASCCVVIFVFPSLIPRLTLLLERKLT